MLLAALGPAVLAQLAAAEIAIDLSMDSAVVEASYEVLQPADSIVFILMRLPGQALHLRPGSPSITLTTPGLYRLAVAHAGLPERRLRVRYAIVGHLRRIPIAVPDVSPVEVGPRVLVRVSGLSRTAALDDGFPRLIPQPDGTATAELETVPSVLRTPPESHRWSINRLSEASVVVLVLFASTLWLARRRMHVSTADAPRNAVR